MEHEHAARAPRGRRAAALLLAGMVVGTLLAVTPAGAHVAEGGAAAVQHLWADHIRPRADNRYYRQAQAEARFVRRWFGFGGGSVPPGTDTLVAFRSNGVQSIVRTGTGEYTVAFTRNVGLCVSVATIAHDVFEGLVKTRHAVPGFDPPNEVYVSTATASGAASDRLFQIVLVC